MVFLLVRNNNKIKDNIAKQIGPSNRHYVAPFGGRVTSITKNGHKTMQETMSPNIILPDESVTLSACKGVKSTLVSC